MKENFALIIGINDYTPPNKRGLKTLLGAINDANEFEKWVRKENGGNVPEDNCFKILSTNNPLKPLQDDIDSAIEAMIDLIKSKGGKARRLYFYFAGHGLGSMHNTSDTALCLPKWSELRRKLALSSDSYKDTMRQFGFFEEIIFITDCCRNTKINVDPLPSTLALQQAAAAAGTTKMFIGYATLYQDQSYEIETDELDYRGIFTSALLEGLEGAAADENGVVNADNLRDYLIMEIPKRAQEEGFKQKPEIFHSFTSDVPLLQLKNISNTSVVCHITFSDTRNNEVLLIHGNGQSEAFNAGANKTVRAVLGLGKNILLDKSTNELHTIQVSPQNAEIYVNF